VEHANTESMFALTYQSSDITKKIHTQRG